MNKLALLAAGLFTLATASTAASSDDGGIHDPQGRGGWIGNGPSLDGIEMQVRGRSVVVAVMLPSGETIVRPSTHGELHE